jgi:hypothetical protein
MKDEHLALAIRKFPLPAQIWVDSPSKEWLLKRAINIGKYIQELAAAESVNS